MEIITADQAARLIADRWTIASAGFVGAGHAEAVTEAIERRYLAEAAPKDLTLVYSAGQGDRARRGVNHFGHPGLTRRIIGGHWRSAPMLSRLALDEQAEAYNFPQGVITHLYRAIAAGTPGVITRIGLNTFIDPRHAGGGLNARSTAPLVDLIEIGGEPFLRYRPFPIDCALVRGTTADARGNISCEEEPFHHELLAIAQAARNSGGIVIAQVKRLIDRHDNAREVRLPGILVDYLVVAGEHPEHHSMTFGEYLNPAYTGSATPPARPSAQPAGQADTTPDPAPLTARRIVQRRALLALLEARPQVVNLGVGMPAGVGAVAREEGVDQFVLTVEAGPIGGTPADGLSFGASEYPEAIVDEPAQFDFYDGGGLDIALLGMAEFDRSGNVNVGVFGEGEGRSIAGVGGFINITQATPELVFLGTLTAGGLEVGARDRRLTIVSEGRHRKMLERVGQLCFNGRYAGELGTRVTYVTERAVFRLIEGRLVLTEIAPGIDLEREVLALCPPGLAVASDLTLMDERLFDPAPMGLAAQFPSTGASARRKSSSLRAERRARSAS
jgi:propionate CoA-transferase